MAGFDDKDIRLGFPELLDGLVGHSELQGFELLGKRGRDPTLRA
jgi:hypothetical protein